MKFKHQVILCCNIIFVLSLAIWYQLQWSDQQKTKPRILCTTSIIADVVQNIGQDSIEVITLMGPGIDPHLYKPIESDIIKIASADIVFYNGLHLEAKIADLFEQLATTQTTIAVTQNIPQSMLLQIDQYNQIFDPHIWFDINLWIYAVNTICQTLVEKFPFHKNLYEKNTKKYIQQLEQLLMQTHAIMNKIPQEQRILITGHDAFSYFGRVYNCKVIGLQGISTESSPGIYDIQKIIQLICNNNIPAIFIESSIPIKNILAVQEGVAAQCKKINIGGELYSDALGPQNSSGNTYINMILHNVITIAQALKTI
ncbi:MAG: zinc ABC transporter substrate-binding protein [Candidatus Dependentiae bacterium]|nr:zinc ABC transporter substrate-binding protein [Candidatus Dependentiae bacterium]